MRYQHTVAPGDPPVGIDEEGLAKRVAQFCKNNAITNQAQWEAAVAVRFDATNASGLTAGTRTFMVEFFTKFVRIG